MSPAPTRTADAIRAEIEQQLGFFPPFLGPALPFPEILEGLWRQARSAYFDNPLPARLKESLLAYFGRYNSNPYAIVSHACALRALGMKGPEILRLLETPPGTEPAEGDALLKRLSEAAAPSDGDLLEAAVQIFLNRSRADRFREATRRVLGERLYAALQALIGFARAHQYWLRAYPGVRPEADPRVRGELDSLLREEPRLAEFFRGYRARVRSESEHWTTLQYRESVGRFQSIFEEAPIGMMIASPDRRIFRVNRAFGRMLGYDDGEIEGKTIEEITHPDDAEASREAARRCLSGEASVVRLETRYVKKDGSPAWVSLTATAVRDPKGGVVYAIGMVEDITERKAARGALQESEERFRRMFEEAPIGIVLVDSSFRYLRANRKFCEILGYDEDDLVGRFFGEITHPEDLGKNVDLADEVVRSGMPSFQMEKRYVRKGGEPVWAILTAAPIRDRDGRFCCGVGMIEDITDRKRSEERIQRLNEGLERRVKERTAALESANRELEAFCHTVSHDLRAPARAMDGYARILLDEHAALLPDPARLLLSRICENAQQMDQLIQDLLEFSELGKRTFRIRRVDPAGIVRGALADLAPERAGRAVEISVGELPACDADPAFLKEVWLNLLSNAIKFTRGRDPARIEVGYRPADALAAGAYFVRDNGVGFDGQYAHRLFGVFQRLHREEEFEGTGVGLAIVKRIVEGFGGRTWAEAEPGKGATFFFTIGCAPGPEGSP